MARMEGFEPPTAWFVARYSIQLSYMRVSGVIDSQQDYLSKFFVPAIQTTSSQATLPHRIEVREINAIHNVGQQFSQQFLTI